jgi:hypothetical protein
LTPTPLLRRPKIPTLAALQLKPKKEGQQIPERPARCQS